MILGVVENGDGGCCNVGCVCVFLSKRPFCPNRSSVQKLCVWRSMCKWYGRCSVHVSGDVAVSIPGVLSFLLNLVSVHPQPPDEQHFCETLILTLPSFSLFGVCQSFNRIQPPPSVLSFTCRGEPLPGHHDRGRGAGGPPGRPPPPRRPPVSPPPRRGGPPPARLTPIPIWTSHRGTGLSVVVDGSQGFL